jgi:hypothetical protein
VMAVAPRAKLTGVQLNTEWRPHTNRAL